MIGKAEVDDNMKADIQRQMNDALLMQMLKQKEKNGVSMDPVFSGRTDHSE